MSPLGWFLLGVVVGAGCMLFGWCLWAAWFIIEATNRTTERIIASRASHGCLGPSCWCHKMRERGGRVSVGER